jgi:hypothetical protein
MDQVPTLRLVMLNEVKHLARGRKVGTEFGGANPFQAGSFAIAQDDRGAFVASFPTPAASRPGVSG